MNRRWGRLGWVILAMLLAFGLQYGVLPALGLGLASPDLPLALVVCIALVLGPAPGTGVALVLGLMADALTGWGMGLTLLRLTLATALCAAPSARSYKSRFWLAGALTALTFLGGEILQALVLYISRVPVFPNFSAFSRMALGMALSAFLAWPLYIFLNRRLTVTEESIRGRYNPRIGW